MSNRRSTGYHLEASMIESRREYLTPHRSARAWAALDRATNAQMKVPITQD